MLNFGKTERSKTDQKETFCKLELIGVNWLPQSKLKKSDLCHFLLLNCKWER